jgi:predicted Zn-dependent peptidase
MVGTFGDPLEMRDPTMLQLLAYLPPGGSVDKVLVAVDEEVAGVAGGVDDAELARVVTGMISEYLRQLDNVLDRAIVIGVLEQQRRRPQWVNDLPDAVASVTGRQIAAIVTTWLAGTGRAVLEVVPGAAP